MWNNAGAMTNRSSSPTPSPLLLLLALAILAAGIGLGIWLNETGTDAHASSPAATEASGGAD